jgi:hypothetical protein
MININCGMRFPDPQNLTISQQPQSNDVFVHCYAFQTSFYTVMHFKSTKFVRSSESEHPKK